MHEQRFTLLRIKTQQMIKAMDYNGNTKPTFNLKQNQQMRKRVQFPSTYTIIIYNVIIA